MKIAFDVHGDGVVQRGHARVQPPMGAKLGRRGEMPFEGVEEGPVEGGRVGLALGPVEAVPVEGQAEEDALGHGLEGALGGFDGFPGGGTPEPSQSQR